MSDTTVDIPGKVAASLISELFKLCFEGFREADDWIKSKSKEYDPFGIAARRYTERLEERYNSMRIFGMSSPVPLRKIYTRVNILKKVTARTYSTIEELLRHFDFDKRVTRHTRETKDGIQTVNELRRLLVLGKPGAGKTTFLKHIALQALDDNLRVARIPVFITLKSWADSGLPLLNFVVKQFDICNFPDAEKFVERVLRKGGCILLLDGLDEVSTKIDAVIADISDFTEKYSTNQFVLSCRIAAYNYCFEKFTDIEVADFNEEQIQSFINNWFGSNTVKAELCWEKMKDDPPIMELATIPLLLTMLCLAFNESMDFSSNRSELYKDALDALLKKWDSSRSITREEIYRNLSTRRKESMFSRVAAAFFEKDQYFFPKRVLEDQIANYIQNMPEASQETLDIDSEAILKAIEAQHGIFVERAKGIYSFSHLTFQEYFTARNIVDNAARGTLESLIKYHLFDERWREVFLLAAGMLEDADNFLQLIQVQIDDFAKRNIRPYLRAQLNNMVRPKSRFSIPVSKVVAILYFLRISTIIPDGELGHIRSLASTLDSTLNPYIQIQNYSILCDAFYAERFPAIINSIEDDYARDASLLSYLRITKLLVDCLNTQCYISRGVRQRIYDSLLLF